MEDEIQIDVRDYIDVLARRWRLILTLTALALAAAGLIVLLTPHPPYQAVASVAIIKTKTDLEFDPRFKTDLDIASAAEARRNALLGLVSNGAIASQVIADLENQLAPAERNPAALLKKIDAELMPKGDLIQITGHDQEPQLAADLANAWGRAYERYVNALYGGAPTEYSSSVQTELERARQEYEQAQAALETFVANNRIEELSRQIAETRQALTGLAQQRSDAVSSELTTETSILKNYYATQAELYRLLNDARALRTQVAQGGESSVRSNSLSILLLKAQAFSSGGSLPASLQLALGDMGDWQQSAADQAADLDALIAALEQQQKQVDQEIARQVQALQNKTELKSLPAAGKTPLDQLFEQYNAQLLQASSALEREQATQKQLTQQRDLAWETYTTLARKQAEVSIASAVTGSEVRFAAPAVPPTQRPSSGKAKTLAIAGALGLLLGIAAAFGIEYLGGGGPPQALWGHPRFIWNRVFCWVMGEGRGLPYKAALEKKGNA